LGLSAALLFLYLGFIVDLGAAWGHVSHAQWSYLLPLAAWITLDRLLMSYKWLFLVRCRGMLLSFRESLRSYYLATFAGCFLPTTLGADAVRVASLSQANRPSHLLAASIIMERALGFVAAALAAAGALVLLASHTGTLPPRVLEWSLILLAVSVGGVLLSISAWSAGLLAALSKMLERRGRVLAWGGRFLGAYSQYRLHGPTLALFLGLSLLEQCAPIVGTWLAALSLHVHLTLTLAAAVTPLALIATRIPLSVSGFGVIEGFYMVFFPLVGVSATDAFLLGLVGEVTVLVATLPGGVIYALGGFKTPTPTPTPDADAGLASSLNKPATGAVGSGEGDSIARPV
jgi:uncharacterized protein (TIRG00374 family)